mmetsp:Transcript_32109/g.83180  ORF Transcript_32109/g.83180 Transcript_32109/m.83180 type:complete len:400 (+) Transcript_32109:713-1912(+)
MQRLRLCFHLHLCFAEVSPQLLQRLLTLLAVLDQEQVVLLQFLVYAQKLVGFCEIHAGALLHMLLLWRLRRLLQLQHLRQARSCLPDCRLCTLCLLLSARARIVCLRLHLGVVRLLLQIAHLLAVCPPSIQLRLAPADTPECLLLEKVGRRDGVQEVLIFVAVLQLLFVLAELTADGGDRGVEPLDLLQLVLLGLGCDLRLFNRRLHLLVVLLQEGVKALRVLLQHLLALLQRLLPLRRPLLQLANLGPLGVQAHLDKEYLALLLDKVSHDLLLPAAMVRGHCLLRRRITLGRTRAAVLRNGALPLGGAAAAEGRLLRDAHVLQPLALLRLACLLRLAHAEHLLLRRQHKRICSHPLLMFGRLLRYLHLVPAALSPALAPALPPALCCLGSRAAVYGRQ